MTPKITEVEARSGHRLRVRFENGEERLFDVSPYLNKGIFQELRDEAYFRRVRPVWGGVEWPHEQDLSADTLYLASKAAATSGTAANRSDPPPAFAARDDSS